MPVMYLGGRVRRWAAVRLIERVSDRTSRLPSLPPPCLATLWGINALLFRDKAFSLFSGLLSPE